MKTFKFTKIIATLAKHEGYKNKKLFWHSQSYKMGKKYKHSP